MSFTTLLSVLFAASAALATPPSTQGPHPLEQLLQEHSEFSESDWARLDEGQAVVKLPAPATDWEVVVLGVVGVDVPADYLIERLRRIEMVIVGGGVASQIGRFGEPPSLDDMAGFSLPRRDARALRFCRRGDCDVKLPAAAMERIRNVVDWSAADAEVQADRALRRWMLEYLNRYRRDGDAALATYEDKSEPLNVAEGFRVLMRESSRTLRDWPELYEYLDRFPDVELDGAEDFYYWSVEDFGLKPVTHLYHTTIYRPPGADLPAATLARKQIYASHYFQAAITLIGVFPAPPGGSDARTYLTMLRRQRFDGELGGLKRVLLERRVRDSTIEQLEDVQRRLEDSYLAAVGGGG